MSKTTQIISLIITCKIEIYHLFKSEGDNKV